MPKRNLAWILVVAMITLLMWQLPQTIAGRDAVFKSFGPLADVKAQIRKRFVERMDDAELTTAAVEAGIRAMVASLHDPYAIYFTAPQYERFKRRSEGEFGGIGVDVWPATGGVEVLSRDPRSPAAAADIEVGDVITHVDGEDVTTMALEDLVNHRLNGPPGTDVRLRVIPQRGPKAGMPLDRTLQRAIIQVDPVRGWSRAERGDWRYLLDAKRRIAYVRITKFTNDVAERLDAAVATLLSGGLRGLVLDLRDNPGGLLDSAREVADRFLEGGLIVRVQGRTKDAREWSAMRDGTYPGFAMAVLVNGSTASAAEIVSGALRDHRRATVIGERSYGKGSVQEVVELDSGRGAIKLTTAYYYLPSGHCINRTPGAADWGVHPNVEVLMTPDQRRKMLEVQHRITLESGVSTTAPAGGPPPTSDEINEAALQSLLAVDLQLREAMRSLRKSLRQKRPPAAAARGGSNLFSASAR